MLKTSEEIKQYVLETIRSGNKKRIQAVMKRYLEYLKEEKKSAKEVVDNAYEAAKKIFK